MITRGHVWFLGCIVLLPLVGCEGGDVPRMARVSGRVLVDGKPLANVRVMFAPVGSQDRPFPGPPSSGLTDDTGHYKLFSSKDNSEGAVVGPCRVRIHVREEIPEDIEKARTRVVKQLPVRFNDQTTLKFDVPPQGTEKADFEVSWK